MFPIDIMFPCFIVVAIIFIFNITEVKKCTKSKATLLWTTPLLILMTVCFIAVILLLPIFVVYRLIIFIFLKIKHGSQFMGFLNGPDAFHVADKKINDVIHVLIIVQCSKGTAKQDAFNDIKQRLCKLLFHYKFKTELHRFCGYNYFLKKEPNNDEHVKTLKRIDFSNDKITQEDLQTLLNDCYNLPLTSSWDAHVGTQLVEWENDDYDYYPSIFRVHHTVSDGVTLWKLMVATFGEKQNHTASAEKSKIAIRHRLQRVLLESLLILRMCFLLPATAVINVFLKANDHNGLHSTSLIRENVLAFRTEKEEDCVRKIKYIKNSFPGTSFPNVVLAAFSASVGDYLKQKSLSVPDNITIVAPVLPGSEKLRHLTADDIDIENIDIGNNYSCVLMKLPIGAKNGLIEKLKYVNEQADIVKASPEYYVYKMILKVFCPFLPYPVLRFSMKWVRCTTIVSIIAEPPKVFNKLTVINKVAFFLPTLYTLGTTLGVGTYQNKLNVSMSADKFLISDESEATIIINGVFKYIDLLYFEVQHYNLGKRLSKSDAISLDTCVIHL